MLVTPQRMLLYHLLFRNKVTEDPARDVQLAYLYFLVAVMVYLLLITQFKLTGLLGFFLMTQS